MDLKPISLTRSTLYFVVPGILTTLLLTFGFDALVAHGFAPSNAFLIAVTTGFAILLAQFAILYTAEGGRWTMSALARRLRFKPMTGWMWFWTGAVFLFGLATYLGGLALGVVEWWADRFGLPDWYQAVPESVEGVYWLIGARLGLLAINIIGEELLWRGFILPRQEITHGRWAWVVHGVQWTLFHLFKPWEFLMLLPGCLAYAALSQWSQNIWPAIIVHTLFNGLGVILLTLAVFGMIS